MRLHRPLALLTNFRAGAPSYLEWVYIRCGTLHSVGWQTNNLAIRHLHERGPSGEDSGRLTCPLCYQENWAWGYPPHTKGPKETEIAW